MKPPECPTAKHASNPFPMGLQVPNGMAEQLSLELEGSGSAFQGGSKGGNLWSMDPCPLLAPIRVVGIGEDGAGPSPRWVLLTHEEHVPPMTHMVSDGEQSCEARGTSSGIICDGQGLRSTLKVIVPHGPCFTDRGKQVVVELDPMDETVDSDEDVSRGWWSFFSEPTSIIEPNSDGVGFTVDIAKDLVTWDLFLSLVRKVESALFTLTSMVAQDPPLE